MNRSRLRNLSPPTAFLIAGLVAATLLLILLLGFLTFGAPVASASAPAEAAFQGDACGDGYCDTAYEDCNSCDEDCSHLCGPTETGYCGDGVCDGDLQEDCETCSEDCGECGGDPVCGNEEVESGEACDGIGQDECPDGFACSNCQCVAGRCGDLVLGNSPGEQCEAGQTQNCPGQTCLADCTCGGSTCGNGTIDPGEACDGTDLGSCTVCTPNCTCGGSICGNGIREGSETCDGTDLGNCTVCTPNCTCGGGPACGNGIQDPGETCGDGNLRCPDGQTCDTANCRCFSTCGNGVIDPGEACDGAALGTCEVCNADCSCGSSGGFCGDGNLDPGEQCNEPGVECAEGLLCDTATCSCSPGEPCEPVHEEGDDGHDLNNYETLMGAGVEGLGHGYYPGTEICEEGDCLNPGAGIMNTWGWSGDVPSVECCDANGLNCILHASVDITYYTAPDGSVQLCSADFDRYCTPGQGPCIPTSTDDLPGGGRMLREIEGREILADVDSGGQLASVLPQATRIGPLYGYVCDDPGELCIDVADSAAFSQSLLKDGQIEDYQGVVLWECKDGEGTQVPVNITNNSYVDQTITVPVGTTVTWTNNDPGQHSVTSDDGQFFNSGPLAQSQTFSVTFEIFGEYGYYSQGEGGPNGQGMSGTVIVTPLCVQKPLTLTGTTRACAQCDGDWCGFGPGRPECILVPHNEMPNLAGFDYQGEYARVENQPESVAGNLSDGVWVLICPAPPQGHICIPIDAQMKAVYDNPAQAVGLTDCFSGDPNDNVNCPVLNQQFAIETDAGGQNHLCFDAGGNTGFDPSCGPHPGSPFNGCAFSAQGESGGIAGSLLPQDLPGGLPLWLLLLILGLLLLIIIIFIATRRRGGNGDPEETLIR